MTKKTCARCKVKKPLTEFNACRSLPGGKQRWCRSCQREYRKAPRTSMVNVDSRPAWERQIIQEFLGDFNRLAASCPAPDVLKFLETWRDVRGSKKDWREDVVSG